jgi:hypothetical protein
MTITFAGNDMKVVNDDGYESTIQLSNVVQVSVHRYPFKEAAVPNPADGVETTANPWVNVPVWYVHVDAIGIQTRIQMGTVSNQATWVNTAAGAEIARAAIVAAFP